MELKESIVILCVLSVTCVHAIKCTAAGRFPDTDDPTCKNFTLCIYYQTTGTYLSYNYVCPEKLVFHPNLGYCISSYNYDCPKIVNISSVCTSEGYTANPNDASCSSYIECVNIDGVYRETVYICPLNTYFNPYTTLCESGYICPSRFKCTSAGRFADTSGRTCQTYYLCVASKGTFLQYQYTCLSTSVFSPIARLCTTKYICRN